MIFPINLRSNHMTVPTDSESPRTCVPSTMGNRYSDSRIPVPMADAWMAWHTSKIDIRQPSKRTFTIHERSFDHKYGERILRLEIAGIFQSMNFATRRAS